MRHSASMVNIMLLVSVDAIYPRNQLTVKHKEVLTTRNHKKEVPMLTHHQLCLHKYEQKCICFLMNKCELNSKHKLVIECSIQNWPRDTYIDAVQGYFIATHVKEYVAIRMGEVTSNVLGSRNL